MKLIRSLFERRGQPIRWISDNCFGIDGYRITLDWQHGGSKRPSSDRDFTMMKGRGFLDHYTALANTGIKSILELGIYQGGSVVFLDKLLAPDKLSAIDLTPTPIPSLDLYADQSSGRVKIYYGTSQDDVAKLNEIITSDFGGSIDFVVDDASHFYGPSKAAFKTIFPHIKPGGYYFIEDWSWSFQPAFQDETNDWFSQDSLANIVIDLMEDMVYSKAIESIEIVKQMIKVKRSSEPLERLFAIHARRSRLTTPL